MTEKSKLSEGSGETSQAARLTQKGLRDETAEKLGTGKKYDVEAQIRLKVATGLKWGPHAGQS